MVITTIFVKVSSSSGKENWRLHKNGPVLWNCLPSKDNDDFSDGDDNIDDEDERDNLIYCDKADVTDGSKDVANKGEIALRNRQNNNNFD